MKKRPNTLPLTALLILVVCLGVASATAQSYASGSFTLPYEVDWHGETIPAGQYSFEIQQSIPQAIVIIRDMEHPRQIMLIGSAAAVSKAPLRSSALEIVTVDGKHYVHSLDISPVGASLIYWSPKLSDEKSPKTNEASRIAVAGGNQGR
jgi:hypothetical protein